MPLSDDKMYRWARNRRWDRLKDRVYRSGQMLQPPLPLALTRPDRPMRTIMRQEHRRGPRCRCLACRGQWLTAFWGYTSLTCM